jgi:hypothetical protein
MAEGVHGCRLRSKKPRSVRSEGAVRGQRLWISRRWRKYLPWVETGASTIEALLLISEQLASFSEGHIRLRHA